MNKRASAWVDGEKLGGVRVYRIDNTGREALISLRRMPLSDTFEAAPDVIDVDWSGTTYEAEKMDIENGHVVYEFDLETEETRY